MNLRELPPLRWLTREEPMSRLWPDTSRSEYPLNNLQQQIDRLFDQAMRNLPSMPEWSEGMSQVVRPKLDIREAGEAYIITVEVPGVQKDDVHVEVKHDSLIISGEKKQETEKKEERYHRVERSYGTFRRVLALPDDAKGDDIRASFKDGILTLRVPRDKSAGREAKKITIQ